MRFAKYIETIKLDGSFSVKISDRGAISLFHNGKYSATLQPRMLKHIINWSESLKPVLQKAENIYNNVYKDKHEYVIEMKLRQEAERLLRKARKYG